MSSLKSRGASGIYFMSLMTRLGIADEVKGKIVHPEAGVRVGTIVARGEAELGVQQITELLPIPGIDFVGPLPAELQTTIVYGAAVPTSAKEREATGLLVKFLTSEAVLPTLKKMGLDPATDGPVQNGRM